MTIMRKKMVGAYVGVMSHKELMGLRKIKKLAVRKVGSSNELANVFSLFICVLIVVER
jgi:hypothetical protein